MLKINQTGNGNPPPNKPRRSEVPKEQEPVQEVPVEQPK